MSFRAAASPRTGRTLAVGAALLLALAGCATHSTTYTPPAPAATKSPAASGPVYRPSDVVITDTGSFVVVPRPAQTLQHSATVAAPQRGFALEAASVGGGLTLHYSGDPQSLVDCGHVTSTVRTDRGDQNYDFPASSAFVQYQVMRNNKVFQVERRMSLDATVTLSFVPVSSGRTRVDARARYLLTRMQTATAPGYVKPLVLNDSVEFASGGSATFPNAATRCEGTGKLEGDALALVR